MQTNDNFPFTLSDISGWIIKRKDGTTVKFTLVNAQDVAGGSTSKKTVTTAGTAWYGTKKSYSAWCNHEPHPAKGDLPIFALDGIALWVGDNPGASKSRAEFDVCIDAGNVLSIPGEYDLPTLYGDPGLRRSLREYVNSSPKAESAEGTRILKIRWADRAKPPVRPEFWPALLDQLKGIRDEKGYTTKDPLRVMTICQGGHGRSGSALACLVMCLTDYTPLDVLTHIRALHCARAIESKEQHEYLNTVAGLLGRKQDALEAESVPSFKQRFLKMTSPFAEPYKARIESGGGAVLEAREGSYL